VMTFNNTTFIRSYDEWKSDIAWSHSDYTDLTPDIFSTKVHLYSSDLRDAIIARLGAEYAVSNHTYNPDTDDIKYYKRIMPNTVIYARHVTDGIKAILDIDSNVIAASDTLDQLWDYTGLLGQDTISYVLVSQVLANLKTIHDVCFSYNFNLYNESYQTLFNATTEQYRQLGSLFNIFFGHDYGSYTDATTDSLPIAMLPRCDYAFPYMLNINRSLFGDHSFVNEETRKTLNISNIFGNIKSIYLNYYRDLLTLDNYKHSLYDTIRLLIIGSALSGSTLTGVGRLYHNKLSPYAYFNVNNYTFKDKSYSYTPGVTANVLYAGDNLSISDKLCYMDEYYDGMYLTGTDNASSMATSMGHIVIDRFIGWRFDSDNTSFVNNPTIHVSKVHDNHPKIEIIQTSSSDYSTSELKNICERILDDSVFDSDKIVFHNASIIDYRLYSRFNLKYFFPSSTGIKTVVNIEEMMFSTGGADINIGSTGSYGTEDDQLGRSFDYNTRYSLYPSSLIDVFNNLSKINKVYLADGTFYTNSNNTDPEYLKFPIPFGTVDAEGGNIKIDEGNLDPLGCCNDDLVGMYDEITYTTTASPPTIHKIFKSSRSTAADYSNSDSHYCTLEIRPDVDSIESISQSNIFYNGISHGDLGFLDSKYSYNNNYPAAMVLDDGSIKVCFYGEIHPNGFGTYPYYLGLFQIRFYRRPTYSSTHSTTLDPLFINTINANATAGKTDKLIRSAKVLADEVGSTSGDQLAGSIKKLETFVNTLLSKSIPPGSTAKPALATQNDFTLTNSNDSQKTFVSDNPIIYYGIQRIDGTVAGNEDNIGDPMLEYMCGGFGGFEMGDLSTYKDNMVVWHNGQTYNIASIVGGLITLEAGEDPAIPLGDPYVIKWRNSDISEISKLNAIFGGSDEFVGSIGYFPKHDHARLLSELRIRLDQAKNHKIFEAYNSINAPIAISGEFGISIGGSGEVIIPNSSGWTDAPAVMCAGTSFRNPGNNDYSKGDGPPMTLDYSVIRGSTAITDNWKIAWTHTGNFTSLMTVSYLAVRSYLISPSIYTAG